MELIFEQSPKEAQYIVNHLQDPTFFPNNNDYRSAYFVGESHSEKTIMAKAIAYKMAQHGWSTKFLSSRSILKKNSYKTAIQLRNELENIAASKRPTILIFYDLNQLLEYNNSKYNDADLTDSVLWDFVDKQKYNKNFFLIGTMNRTHKLTKRTKSRILGDIIEFPSTNNDVN